MINIKKFILKLLDIKKFDFETISKKEYNDINNGYWKTYYFTCGTLYSRPPMKKYNLYKIYRKEDTLEIINKVVKGEIKKYENDYQRGRGVEKENYIVTPYYWEELSTINPFTIPNEYKIHFLKGLFHPKRRVTKGKILFSSLNKDKKTIEFLCKWIKNNFDYDVRVLKSKNTYQLRINKKELIDRILNENLDN